MNKNRHIKKNLAANLEEVPKKVTDSLDRKVREDFPELLRTPRIRKSSHRQPKTYN